MEVYDKYSYESPMNTCTHIAVKGEDGVTRCALCGAQVMIFKPWSPTTTARVRSDED